MSHTPPNEALLSVENLSVEFVLKNKSVSRVINDLSFSLNAGETLGIVGESGCGKSMSALAIMGLVPSPPGRIASGKIKLSGEDLLLADESRLRNVRGNEISMIFQEPMTSLNPVYSIGEQIAETVRLHQGLSHREAHNKAIEMLRAVGIPAPEKRVNDFPHHLSGGMRQRVMIAMSLACEPKVLIADEPTTALDVTVQAQIFDLLRDLQQKTGTAIILITHDMGVVAEMTQRVVVMYAGRKVEQADVDDVLSNPTHPYTRGLITCVPHLMSTLDDVREPLPEIPGVVPSVHALGGDGCPFEPRCSESIARCTKQMPPISQSGPTHEQACWLHEDSHS